jgi:beta-glucosidase
VSTPLSPTAEVPTAEVPASEAVASEAPASEERAEQATLRFPAGFLWGASTAAYQIEGAASADGRGPSIWDTFSHTPGRVRNGDTGDVAVDHYHRYAEDIALLAALGVKAYRFSVSWPRVQPDGRGPVNQRGLDFYRRLVDTLAEHGIEPVVTLYHWDLPQALQDDGGWANRETAARFADYAATVAGALGDRVQNWTTLNEPWCSAFLGYAIGVHAPGIADPRLAFRAAHHLLLGHGLAAHAVRAETLSAARVSLVLNPAPVVPASDSPADIDAARRVDAVQNRLWLDAVLRGHYPEDLPRDAARWTGWDFVRPGDEHVIAAPLDMLGVNYYQPITVAAGEPGDPAAHPGTAGTRPLPQPGPRTAMDWQIEPRGLVDVLVRIHSDYPRLPLLVTENGAAFNDRVGPDGRVHDADRIQFLDGHVRAAHAALQRGVDLRGFFVWSFLDNFEWAEGYAKRFGLVYVDYASQRRILKDSGYWFRDVVARNGVA